MGETIEKVKAYKKFIEEALEEDILGNIPKNACSNDVVGAIACPAEYLDFKEAFKNHVKTVWEYKDTKKWKKKIKTILWEIASPSWGGPYSELIAYDVFIQSGIGDIEVEITLPSTVSYASEVERQETNEDIWLKDFDAYAEVKRLTHVSDTFIKKIIDEVESSFSNRISILYELFQEFEETELNNNRVILKEELMDYVGNLIKKGKEHSKIKSEIFPALSYNIMIDGHFNSSENFYDPFIRIKF